MFQKHTQITNAGFCGTCLQLYSIVNGNDLQSHKHAHIHLYIYINYFTAHLFEENKQINKL